MHIILLHINYNTCVVLYVGPRAATHRHAHFGRLKHRAWENGDRGPGPAGTRSRESLEDKHQQQAGSESRERCAYYEKCAQLTAVASAVIFVMHLQGNRTPVISIYRK